MVYLRPHQTCVAAVEYLTWTADGVLRAVTYQGLRADKPAKEVVREKAP